MNNVVIVLLQDFTWRLTNYCVVTTPLGHQGLISTKFEWTAACLQLSIIKMDLLYYCFKLFFSLIGKPWHVKIEWVIREREREMRSMLGRICYNRGLFEVYKKYIYIYLKWGPHIFCFFNHRDKGCPTCFFITTATKVALLKNSCNHNGSSIML